MPCTSVDCVGKDAETELAVVEALSDGMDDELPMDDPDRDVATEPAGSVAG